MTGVAERRCTCEYDVCAVHDGEVDEMLTDVEAAARFHGSVTVRVRRDGEEWRTIKSANEAAS